MATQVDSITAIVKNVFSTFRTLKGEDPQLSSRVSSSDLSLGVYYHLYMHHATQGTYPELIDDMHRRKPLPAVEQTRSDAAVLTASAKTEQTNTCSVYREDADIDMNALGDYTQYFPFAMAAYFAQEEEIQWSIATFGFDVVVAHAQSATDPLPSYAVMVRGIVLSFLRNFFWFSGSHFTC